MTNREITRLKTSNYVRKALSGVSYWVDFSKKKLEDVYYKKFGDDFSIIIYSEPNSNYYSIPYLKIKQLFSDESLAKSNNGRLRWIGTINDHFLKFTNLPPFDIKAYYITLEETLLPDSQREQAELESIYENKSKDQLKSELQSLRKFNDVFVTINKKTYKRDNKAIALIKLIRDFKCQICGTVIIKRNGSRYIEAAHIHSKAKKGKETTENILILCPNHHKEFDYGDRVINKHDDRLVEFILNGVAYSISLE